MQNGNLFVDVCMYLFLLILSISVAAHNYDSCVSQGVCFLSNIDIMLCLKDYSHVSVSRKIQDKKIDENY